MLSMKQYRFIFINLLLIMTFAAPAMLRGAAYNQDISDANKAFDEGDKEKAKALYEKAAKEGSADAHFALGYKFILPDDEGLFHYIEAAQMGHQQALEYVLDDLLFRADDLRKSNPQKALELYETAKKANPQLKLFDEEDTVEIMKMCAEPKGFNANEFIKKYHIVEDQNNFYGIWELAEEASRGGRFGKPDPKLVLNLIIRGSVVPAEMSAAVRDFYKYWKEGVVKEFNICSYVTSGIGQGYCAEREEELAEAKRASDKNGIMKGWSKADREAFEELEKAASDFFDARVGNEVDLSGTARAAEQIDEEDKLKTTFQDSIKKFEKGKYPSYTEQDFKNADSELNSIYSKIIHSSKSDWKDFAYGTVTPEGIQKAQRKWIPYRDAWVKFGSVHYPKVPSASWKAWLTKTRTDQLQEFTKPLE